MLTPLQLSPTGLPICSLATLVTMGKGGKGKGNGAFYGYDPSQDWYYGKGAGFQPIQQYYEERGRSAEWTPGRRPRRSPTEYYYIAHPDKARGLKVIKCATPNCFGCCLKGEKIPAECYYCHKPFRDSSAGSARGSGKPEELADDIAGSRLFSHCKAMSMTTPDAVQLIKDKLHIVFKPPEEVESSSNNHEKIAASITKNTKLITTNELAVEEQRKAIAGWLKNIDKAEEKVLHSTKKRRSCWKRKRSLTSKCPISLANNRLLCLNPNLLE